MPHVEVLNNFERLENPIFVVGSPRSGTTLVARSLALSPNIAYLEESNLLSSLFSNYCPLRAWQLRYKHDKSAIIHSKTLLHALPDVRNRDQLLEDFVVIMLRSAKLTTFDLKPGEKLVDQQAITLGEDDIALGHQLSKKYRALIKTAPQDILAIAMHDFRLLTKRPLVLEKTPAHFLFIPLILELFADPKVVFVSRSKQDVVSSFSRTFGDRYDNPNKAVRTARKNYELAELQKHLYERMTPIHTITYDDYTRSPALCIQALYRELNLMVPENLLQSLSDVSPRG